nr:MAG TPA: hypothetical protein [Caudoviricetes sp.]
MSLTDSLPQNKIERLKNYYTNRRLKLAVFLFSLKVLFIKNFSILD